jgi:Zn ribbon nucleic-acid-binding protein
MAITGLPRYKPPIEQSLRCPQCERRYLIFCGDGSQFDDALCEAAKDHARVLNAYFVDARVIRILNCLDCGYQFDLMPDEATEVVQ